jgi:GT2 family glycosyltransferase
MKLISASSVDVVIVTYGNRWNYLKKVLDRLTEIEEVNKIIIINNGVKYPINKKTKNYRNVKLISLQNNEGSAVGFNIGIKRAMEENGHYIWLLDDDNLPNKDALKELRNAQKILKNNFIVLSSFRHDRIELLKNGGQSFINNSFFEFDIKTKLFGNKKLKAKSKNQNYNKLLKCEAVPYGGLLLPKNIMKNAEFPNKAYFLYCDDIDFTYKLTLKGYKIYCVIDSVIVDLESSWFRKEKVPMFHGIFKTNDLTRGLYSIRNRVHFEKNYIADSKLIYLMNILIYMIYVFIKYMPKSKIGFKRYIIIWDAINKGWKGILGKDTKWESICLV